MSKNIHQRIGEAITSGGKCNIVKAQNSYEEQILTDAGFVNIGYVEEEDGTYALFRIELPVKEVIKYVESTRPPSWGNPPIETKPWWTDPYDDLNKKYRMTYALHNDVNQVNDLEQYFTSDQYKLAIDPYQTTKK